MLVWGIVAICAALVITAHPVLLVPLLDAPRLPLGTPVTAIGLVALAMGLRLLFSPYHGRPPLLDRRLGWLQDLSVWLSLSWAPVATLLAGNLSLGFAPGERFQGGDTASRMYWSYTYAVVGLPLLLAFVRGLTRFLRTLLWLIRSGQRSDSE
jgi:hypothetical protein